MWSAWNDNEALGPIQRGEHTSRMIRGGVGIHLSVDEQDGHPDLGSGDDWTDGVNLKVALAFGELERARDHTPCQEERDSLRHDRAKVGEGLRRDYRADSPVYRRLLQRHCGTQ